MAYSRFRRFIKRRRGRFNLNRRGSKRLKNAVKRITFAISEHKYYERVCGLFAGTSPVAVGWGSIPTLTSALCLKNDWTNQLTLLGNIQQGTSIDTRIGNRIHVKYVQLSILFINGPNVVVNGSTSTLAKMLGMWCRYMVLLDKEPNGTTLPYTYMQTSAGTSIALGTTYAGVPTSFVGMDSIDFRDVNQMRQVKVMLDMQHQISLTSQPSVTADQPTTIGTRVVQHYIPVNKTFTFTGQAASTGSDGLDAHKFMKDGDVVLQCSPSDVGCCAVYVKWRVCFTDA